MFDFFGKKRAGRIQLANSIVLAVFTAMPDKYLYIVNQLKESIIFGTGSSNAFPNYTTFSLKRELLQKYEDKKGDYFCIKGVRIFDKIINGFTEVHFYIGYGLLLGYSTPEIKELTPDVGKVDVSRQYVFLFEGKAYKLIAPLLTEEERKLVSSNDIYEVELGAKPIII